MSPNDDGDCGKCDDSFDKVLGVPFERLESRDVATERGRIVECTCRRIYFIVDSTCRS